MHSFIYSESNKRTDFPVRLSDGSVLSSLDHSTVLPSIPVVMTEFVFVSADKRREAVGRVESEITNIIRLHSEDESCAIHNGNR